MRIFFHTNPNGHASPADKGWEPVPISLDGSNRPPLGAIDGPHVVPPRKEDIVNLCGRRYVVREVQWAYKLARTEDLWTGASVGEPLTVAHVYLWS